MKKLMAMSFLFLGTFSMFANGNPIETPKEEQIHLVTQCYKFEVTVVQVVNLVPVGSPYKHIEYGMYTSTQAARVADELQQRFPTQLNSNRSGQLAEHSYMTIDSSFCSVNFTR